ncbi:MAG: hypothetical protein ABII81_10390 [Pseudomonadota bacterium]
MEMRAYWRALISIGNGVAVLQARTQQVGMNKAVLNVERYLPAGGHCELALMPPREYPDGEIRQVRGRAEILTSVLASEQFKITVRWLDMDDNSKRLLDEKLQAASKK